MAFAMLCIICFPAILTLVVTATILALAKLKVLPISDRQILAIGAILLFVSYIATCFLVQFVSKDVYAM